MTTLRKVAFLLGLSINRIRMLELEAEWNMKDKAKEISVN